MRHASVSVLHVCTDVKVAEQRCGEPRVCPLWWAKMFEFVLWPHVCQLKNKQIWLIGEETWFFCTFHFNFISSLFCLWVTCARSVHISIFYFGQLSISWNSLGNPYCSLGSTCIRSRAHQAAPTQSPHNSPKPRRIILSWSFGSSACLLGTHRRRGSKLPLSGKSKFVYSSTSIGLSSAVIQVARAWQVDPALPIPLRRQHQHF